MSLVETREFSSAADMRAFYKTLKASLSNPKLQLTYHPDTLIDHEDAPPGSIIVQAEPISEHAWRKSFDTVYRIKMAVCKEFDITHEQLVGPGRSQKYVIPRHIAMAMGHRLSERSLPYIGKHFGGKDHTTCLSAISKVGPIVKEVCDTVPLSMLIPDRVKCVRLLVEERGLYCQRGKRPRPRRGQVLKALAYTNSLS